MTFSDSFKEIARQTITLTSRGRRALWRRDGKWTLAYRLATSGRWSHHMCEYNYSKNSNQGLKAKYRWVWEYEIVRSHGPTGEYRASLQALLHGPLSGTREKHWEQVVRPEGAGLKPCPDTSPPKKQNPLTTGKRQQTHSPLGPGEDLLKLRERKI